tara:strand:+ start:161 stop:337 length:177 start_codon:yes stop_codon:yes gene_type:complete
MALIGWLLCIPCAIYVWKCMPILFPPLVTMCLEHTEMTSLEGGDSFIDAAMYLDMNGD